MYNLIPALFLLLLSPLTLQAEDFSFPEDKDWHTFIDDALDTYSQKRRGDEAMRTLALRIDEVLDEIKIDLDNLAIDLLNKNQQAWEQQIRSKCSFMADTYRGGSAAGITFRYCIIDEQKTRIQELREMHSFHTSP